MRCNCAADIGHCTCGRSGRTESMLSDEACGIKYGRPTVSQEEVKVAAEAISRATNYAVQGQGAMNVAYEALVAVRGAHFDELKHRHLDQWPPSRARRINGFPFKQDEQT